MAFFYYNAENGCMLYNINTGMLATYQLTSLIPVHALYKNIRHSFNETNYKTGYLM